MDTGYHVQRSYFEDDSTSHGLKDDDAIDTNDEKQPTTAHDAENETFETSDQRRTEPPPAPSRIRAVCKGGFATGAGDLRPQTVHAQERGGQRQSAPITVKISSIRGVRGRSTSQNVHAHRSEDEANSGEESRY